MENDELMRRSERHRQAAATYANLGMIEKAQLHELRADELEFGMSQLQKLINKKKREWGYRQQKNKEYKEWKKQTPKQQHAQLLEDLKEEGKDHLIRIKQGHYTDDKRNKRIEKYETMNEMEDIIQTMFKNAGLEIPKDENGKPMDLSKLSNQKKARDILRKAIEERRH